jgi:hypothetical protein
MVFILLGRRARFVFLIVRAYVVGVKQKIGVKYKHDKILVRGGAYNGHGAQYKHNCTLH